MTLDIVRLHGLHCQRRGGIAAGEACVGAAGVGAGGFDAAPDDDGFVGHEHCCFDDGRKVAQHGVEARSTFQGTADSVVAEAAWPLTK